MLMEQEAILTLWQMVLEAAETQTLLLAMIVCTQAHHLIMRRQAVIASE